MKSLFDTNILIDFLNGSTQAANCLKQVKPDERWISIITYIELLVGARTKREEELFKEFLKTFRIAKISQTVADLSVSIRKQYKIKIPDAIIYASAQSLSAPIITRNIKDFKPHWNGVIVPYEL